MRREEMNEKLLRSVEKIEKAFDRAQQKGQVFGDSGKKRLDDDTYKTYSDTIKAYNVYLSENLGINDMTKAKPKHAYEYVKTQIEKYKAGDTGVAWTLGRFVSALDAFRQVTQQGYGVYKHVVNCGDARVIREELKVEKVVRMAKESTTQKATNGECEKVRQGIADSRSPNASNFAVVTRIQQETGARVAAAFRLQAGDIRVISPNHAEITFVKDKGGLTRTVTITDGKTVDLLKDLKHGKKDGSPLFQIKDREGKDKTIDKAVKEYKNLLEKSADRGEVHRGKTSFSSHSFRKNFAQNRYNDYRTWTRAELEKEKDRRTADDNLKKKYERTIENLNVRRNGWREMTDEQLACWLTSVDIGHGRLDVMRYYIDRK